MKIHAPNPRYRIYGGLQNIISILREFALATKNSHPEDVDSFEKQIAEFLQVKHVICAPQNRVGVYHVIKTLITPGQYVIMSPYTIADIINMVILAGGKPLFADTERQTCNISASEVRQLITEYRNVGAVLVTHLHGLAAPTHEILELCEQYSIPMVEDAAQGFGARENGVRLGTIGKAGIVSFGSYKNLNTWLGGAVVTNDDQLAKEIRQQLSCYSYQKWGYLFKKLKKGILMGIATYPPLFKFFTFWIFRYAFLNDFEPINRLVRTELDISRKEVFPELYKARYTPAQARLGMKQLPNIDRDSATRIANAKIYYEGLKDIPGLIIPPLRLDQSHIYTYFAIQAEDRQSLLKWLMANNRDIAAQHYKNCADLKWFGEFYRDCPNTRAIAEQLIFLPTYPTYGENNVKANVEAIRAYFTHINQFPINSSSGQQAEYRGAA